MTRWARSGSTQKHKKMPSDPTPWQEFSSQMKTDKQTLKKRKSKKKKELSHESDKKIISGNLDKEAPTTASNAETKNNEQKPEEPESQMKTDKQTLKRRKSKKKKELSHESDKKIISGNLDKEAPTTASNAETKNNDEQKPEEPESVAVKSKKTTESGPSERKFKRGRKKFNKNGGTLPPNTEVKLYKMKKKLKDQNVPDDDIKQMMRKKRRTEELKFRKACRKPCFNCRKPGHLLQDCPLIKNSEDTTGLCFKCGSTEHKSSSCPNKSSKFSFAKCFICQEQGHICRECPKNKRGIYPKGGGCRLCGNVNHFRRDCPLTKKKSSEDKDTFAAVHMITEGKSVDDEIMDS